LRYDLLETVLDPKVYHNFMDKWDKNEKKQTDAMRLQQTIGRFMVFSSVGALGIYLAFYF